MGYNQDQIQASENYNYDSPLNAVIIVYSHSLSIIPPLETWHSRSAKPTAAPPVKTRYSILQAIVLRRGPARPGALVLNNKDVIIRWRVLSLRIVQQVSQIRRDRLGFVLLTEQVSKIGLLARRAASPSTTDTSCTCPIDCHIVIEVFDEAPEGEEQYLCLSKSRVKVNLLISVEPGLESRTYRAREVVGIFKDFVKLGQVAEDDIAMRLQHCKRNKQNELVGVEVCPQDFPQLDDILELEFPLEGD